MILRNMLKERLSLSSVNLEYGFLKKTYAVDSNLTNRFVTLLVNKNKEKNYSSSKQINGITKSKLDLLKKSTLKRSEGWEYENYLEYVQFENGVKESVEDWLGCKFELTGYDYKAVTDHIKSLDKEAQIKLLGFGNDGNWEFSMPASLEFRGIMELYNTVMWELLAISFILVVLCVFIIYKTISAYIENWSEIKDTYNKEKRIISLSDILSKSHLKRIEENREIYRNFSKANWVRKDTNEITKVDLLFKSGIRIFFSHIDYMLCSTTFWVYYSKLEFIWTLIPCIILLFISIPSFTLALALDETHKPASWIKVVGNQWYWVYEYSTYSENVTIYSNIVYGSDTDNNALRVLELDSIVTIVNNRFTRLLITSADVIHCWAVPSLGIKIDACPGRINSISVLPTKVGVYYGQCSEICGVNHGFMPICVEVIA